MLRSFLKFLLLLLLCGDSTAAYAQSGPLTVQVSPRTGSLEDSFLLSITLEGVTSTDRPTLTGGDGFTIQYLGPQSSMQIINGVVSSQLTFNYQMIPQRTGDLLTPQVEVIVGGTLERAAPQKVRVEEASHTLDDDQTSKDIMLEQRTGKAHVYVGEQLPYQLELRTKVPILEFQFPDLSFDKFWSETVSNNEQSRRRINGENYTTLLTRRALYALVPGETEIAPRVLELKVRDKRSRPLVFPFDNTDPFGGSLFDDLFGGGAVRERRISSNPLHATILPLPSKPAGFPLWGSEANLSGKTELSVNASTSTIKIGESKTVTISVTSTANLNPLKSVPIELPSFVRVYEESPRSKTMVSDSILIVNKVFQLSLVPTAGGTATIPSLKLGYFNPDTRQYAVAESTPITFRVEGALAPEASSEAPLNNLNEEQTTLLEFDQKSSFSKFIERFSLQFLLLSLCAILAMLALLMIFMARKRSAQSRSRFQTRLQNVQSFEQLHRTLEEIFAILWLEEGNALHGEDLKALIRQKIADPALLFEVQDLLDQLELIRFAPEQKSPTPLSTLKERSQDAIKRVLLANSSR